MIRRVEQVCIAMQAYERVRSGVQLLDRERRRQRDEHKDVDPAVQSELALLQSNPINRLVVE